MIASTSPEFRGFGSGSCDHTAMGLLKRSKCHLWIISCQPIPRCFRFCRASKRLSIPWRNLAVIGSVWPVVDV
jgi:hypothetical protein